MQQSSLALSIPDSEYYVPLRDWSAACLLDVVSSKGLTEKQRLLHQVLSTDPALLLWAAVCREDVRAWREVTVSSLVEWLVDDLDGLLIRHESKLKWSSDLSSQLLEAQFRSITSARAALARLDESQSNTAPIVYAAAMFARAGDWLFLEDGVPIADELLCLPSWLRFLVDETSGSAEPSIGFMQLVRGSLSDPVEDASDARGFIYEAEETLWSNDIPVIRSIFAKTLQLIQRNRPDCASETARIESAKLTALKELAYGASHEINNPLANISTRAQLLLRDESDSDRRKHLSTINRQAYRAHEMISDLMLFAKPPKIAATRFRIREFLEEMVRSINRDPDLGPAEITVLGSEIIEIVADSAQLDTALRAIVKNSVEACGAAGRIAVEYSSRDSCFDFQATELTTYLEIDIRDNGPGIPPNVRNHLFDPFYSGREAGRGLGFGLAKAWRIIEQHQGQIAVCSNGKGTSVVVSLPVVD